MPKEDSIVLSSRIRLARNMENKPFVNNASLAMQKDLRRNIVQAIKQTDNYSVMEMDSISQIERLMLVEQHIISRELANNVESGAVCMQMDKNLYIMVNEEDHIRLQVIRDDMDFDKALPLANEADAAIGKLLKYAKDEDFGYITCCPTNLGTGMRASVMLHLPALVITNNIQKIVQSVSKLGITIRGFYGEGSEAEADIFQVSNSVTLGVNQADIIRSVRNICKQIIGMELQARESLLKPGSIYITDRVYRAYGLLSNARAMSINEFMKLFSDFKLGIGMDLIKVNNVKAINNLIVDAQPAVIMRTAGVMLKDDEVDVKRAELVRRIIKENIQQ